jgi:WD40 repeat protein
LPCKGAASISTLNNYNQGASYRSEIKLWELGLGRAGRTFKAGAEHYPALAFSLDSKLLAAAEGPVNLWDVATGELKRVLTTERGKVLDAAFSRDGKTLAGGGGYWIAVGGGTQQIAQAWLWDAETGKLRHSFSNLNTWLRAIALPQTVAVSQQAAPAKRRLRGLSLGCRVS